MTTSALSTKTHEELRAELIEKATEDEQFRAHLIAEPKAAIQEVLGIELPESMSVTVHEDSPTSAHLVLPPQARLTDEDLAQVAAGHFSTFSIYKIKITGRAGHAHPHTSGGDAWAGKRG